MKEKTRYLSCVLTLVGTLIGASQLSGCALAAAGAAGAVVGHEVAEENHDDDE